MGQGIAQIAATNNHKVVLFDVHSDALSNAKQKLSKILNRLVEKGRMTQDQSDQILGNIHFSSELKDCATADFIIEAIVENLDIKKKVFRDLEELTSEDSILATNTSSLSVASIAAACLNPEKVIGVHFFNPAPLMKLVEIIPAIQTSEATKDAAVKLIQSWGKMTVIAKDTPGFIVNRVARPFYGEALRIYEEGLADFATIDWAMTDIGQFRMGPFTLMDYIGNDINYTVTETVFEAFYYDGRYKPAFTQKRLSEAGYLGRKTGRGYYRYDDDHHNPEPQQDKALGQDIVERIVVMLINEAADALHLNIASRDDIDTAMTKGVNYPKGLLRWADEMGINRCVQTLDRLFDEYHEERYRCSPLLRKMDRENSTFY